ncbi:DNA/RNA non-specific endonuclease [Clavibacter sp. VKM Ac-2872]|nr:DNA/RNA non-specific endonuclease [Clavibacter sp. VKM Ac-2872]
MRPDRSLEPSTWYQAGEHEYLYRTNEHGHIDRVIIQDLQLKIHEGRLPHQRNPLGKLQGDHAGHLAADAAGGSPKLDNIVAMSQKNNLVQYARLERKLLGRKAAHPDERIFLDIRLDPDPLTGRSPRFEVEYKINGRIYRSNFKQ